VRRLAVLLALILFATSAVAAPAPLRKPPKKEAEKPVERKLGINFDDVDVRGIVIFLNQPAPLQLPPPPPLPPPPGPAGS